MTKVLASVTAATMILLLQACDHKNSEEKSRQSIEGNYASVASISMQGRQPAFLLAVNDGLTGGESPGARPPMVETRPGTQSIQYEWPIEIISDRAALWFWEDGRRVRLPKSYRILWWNGTGFVPAEMISPEAIQGGRFINASYKAVRTSKLRLELQSDSNFRCGVVEWAVIGTDDSPEIAPLVNAGHDRSVMSNGKTYLSASVRSVKPVKKRIWSKKSGPGSVTFGNRNEAATTAAFSEKGDYELEFSVTSGKLKSSSVVSVSVTDPPEGNRLDVVYTKKYKIDSPLWSARARAIIVNWIPHCIRMIERTDLKTGQGGIDNFIEAGKALRGEPHGKHLGYVFSNAWVHQTVESICIALMIDPQGDREIMAAQEFMKKTLEKWIPIILAAQEPDGYLQTAFTLRDTARWKKRWAPVTRGNHEGYVAGYFIESAINHYTLTDGTDLRLYDAAKKLADCWVKNIGPGRKEWFDGHQEMEQALVRFGRFVNDVEGKGKGDDYIALARFLLDSRNGGTEYDQSHVPVQQQYEAVGHAVRAAYNYSAMADIAAETGDVDYESAVMSIWDNLVNRKYYVTGGIGSGETSEGFGPDYSLRHEAYCESCSSCGLIFFQYKMNLAYHEARYADLYEETMMNALLGALDLEGKNFTYTNELNSSHSRYDWHVCPCCVGNIPRTLLMIPTWSYVTGEKGLYVNMYIGSTIKIDRVAGSSVEVVQKTEYPWRGNIEIIINPEQEKEFSLFLRIPDRQTSELYPSRPEVKGYRKITINGETITPDIVKGYAEIRRKWGKGDRVSLEIPMEVQKVSSIDKVDANRGQVALRYGPLVFNVEKIDNIDINKIIGSEPLNAEFRSDLLGGVMTISGKWVDGSPLLAIPYYARNNRNPKPVKEGRESIVWIKNNQ